MYAKNRSKRYFGPLPRVHAPLLSACSVESIDRHLPKYTHGEAIAHEYISTGVATAHPKSRQTPLRSFTCTPYLPNQHVPSYGRCAYLHRTLLGPSHLVEFSSSCCSTRYVHHWSIHAFSHRSGLQSFGVGQSDIEPVATFQGAQPNNRVARREVSAYSKRVELGYCDSDQARFITRR